MALMKADVKKKAAHGEAKATKPKARAQSKRRR
jgi:hypothetical protein